MPPIGSQHAAAVRRLDMLLNRAVSGRAIVSCQSPVELSELSEPQPDLALLAPREDFYDQAHPTAADTLLALEVSDTTARYDLSTKMSLYARHGIRELWVVDLQRQQLHIFRNPAGAAYDETLSLQKPGAMPIASLPGVTVDPSSLFHQ